MLFGQQKVLFESLVEKHDSLGVMYRGALVAQHHTANPDRLAHAAHGIRELMEKLGKHLDIPVEADAPSMKAKVRELESFWEKAKDDATAETMSQSVKKFLRRFAAFFTWFQTQHPKRRESITRVIRGMDPLAAKMPDKIEKLRVDEWFECHDFYQGVAHHTRACTVAEFDGWIDTLERFLLDHLRPRTFEDHAAIDKIIAEGEANA